ncbi:orotidine-5'-phosphate decarboxylase [bacterium]|nr:orotidine-5'-phosphate decarboxylase [bacterium]
MTREDLAGRLRALPATRKIITALDVPGAAEALDLAARLGPDGGFVKVGLELFSAAGPAVVRDLRSAGRDVFLDLKYHDIPNTVAKAAVQAAALGASLCTVHAAAGRAALTAAAEALARVPVSPAAADGRRPALMAVTVLTSMSAGELQETAPSPDSLADRIARLAALAWDCGCDGLICSAADLPAVRSAVGPAPLVVTPGIRPAGAGKDDQHRIATPAQAVRDGADFLVIGRPITQAPDPAAAIAAIAAEIAAA